MTKEKSIHSISILSERDFTTETVRNELEKGSGMIRIRTEKNFEELNESSDWFLEFCKKLGTPVSQSTKGELVLSIRNESFGKNDPRTRGPNTNNKLGFHTDRCDVIAFLCMMPAMSGGENQVVDSRKIAEIIRSERPDLYEVLQQRFPYKRHVIDQGNQKPFVMQPILSACQGYFACSYLRVLIDRADHDDHCPSLTHSQRLAIDFLDEVCERPEIQEKFTMKRGEILLLNNWIKLHRRTAFEDFTEPEKRRHLLRVWISMPNSRPISDAFMENYGSTQAGAIRGGIKPIN